MAQKKDLFTQKLTASITMAAPIDSAGSQRFTDAYRPQDLVGFIIERVEYCFENVLENVMDNNLDRVKFGLSIITAQPIGGFEANDMGVQDWHVIERRDVLVPTIAQTIYTRYPIVKDFTAFSGGGLLVHPVNLFAFSYNDQELGSSVVMHTTIFYTVIELTDELHKELWQSIYVRQI